MLQKQAVLFDMDGTLIDTFTEMKKEQDAQKVALFTRYFNYRMSKLPSYSYTEMVKMIEHDFLMRPFQKTIKAKLNTLMLQRYKRANLKPGAREFLMYLKEKGYQLCLCTNNARHIVEYILKEKELNDVFTHVITSQDVTKPKPDPEMYVCAGKHCGVEASDCIVFEDMLEGVMAARSAHMDCIAVYDAFNVKDSEAIQKDTIMIIQDYTDQRLFDAF